MPPMSVAAASSHRHVLSALMRSIPKSQPARSHSFSSLSSSSTASCPTRSSLFVSNAGTASKRPAVSRQMVISLSPLSFKSFHSSSVSNSADKDPKVKPKRPETRACWKCGSSVPYMALQCSNSDCNVVQTLAHGANYFEILGLSDVPSFDIDLKDLRIKFFKIQQQIHPDSYSQNTNGDQVYAQQQSSLANKAYATLKEPLSRANYMLDLLGAPIHETEKLQESELLMEVMEARELLEDAETEEQVEDLKSVNDARIKETVTGLSKAFKDMDLAEAKTLSIQLQYWIRIQNVIRDWAAGKPVVADHV
ncbi:molecular chaperone HscB [Entomortierella parvispora]|uniref:Molecular chaperone HscB n=1 Tax=Entomortierella parvispora TaxID=205924 RepID=A0A9P3H4U2_9FUNG|nr:molecular chaperone HscB [Entomortierella parvispora]